MKSAEEVAKEVWLSIARYPDKGCEEKIIKGLTAYAEERVKDNLQKCNTFHCESCHQDQDEYGFPPDECAPGCCCENLRQIKKARAEGYAQGIEDAAKICQEWSGEGVRYAQWQEVAKAIRALGEKK